MGARGRQLGHGSAPIPAFPRRGKEEGTRCVAASQPALDWASSRSVIIVKYVNLTETRRRLSQLIDKAALGEDVVVCRHGKPLVRITGLTKQKPRIRFGVLKGKLTVPDDFDAPLDEDTLGEFAGR